MSLSNSHGEEVFANSRVNYVHEISKLYIPHHIVVLTRLNICCMDSSLGFNFTLQMLCMFMKIYIAWSIQGNLTMGWANHIVFVKSFIVVLKPSPYWFNFKTQVANQLLLAYLFQTQVVIQLLLVCYIRSKILNP